MVTRWVVLALWLVWLAMATGAGAQQGYRWVDEQGNVHYAGRRDQVPERYRDQLPTEGPGEPPRPRLTPPGSPGVPRMAAGECMLRIPGTERRRGTSHVYPSCDACWKALAAMKGPEVKGAECIAASVESYR
jgi:hypothetical protein